MVACEVGIVTEFWWTVPKNYKNWDYKWRKGQREIIKKILTTTSYSSFWFGVSIFMILWTITRDQNEKNLPNFGIQILALTGLLSYETNAFNSNHNSSMKRNEFEWNWLRFWLIKPEATCGKRYLLLSSRSCTVGNAVVL